MASTTRFRRTHSVIVAGALGVWLVGGLTAHAAGARLAIQIPRTNMIVAIHTPADAPPEVASVASVDSVAIVQAADRTVVSAGSQATVGQTITISQAAPDVSVLGSARGGGVVPTSSQHASTVQSGGAASATFSLSGAP